MKKKIKKQTCIIEFENEPLIHKKHHQLNQEYLQEHLTDRMSAGETPPSEEL